MHFGIFTNAYTRGDVQPYIALSIGLLEKGHQVTLSAPENFKNFVEGYGIHFFSLPGNSYDLVQSDRFSSILKTNSRWRFILSNYIEIKKTRPYLENALLEGCGNVDVVVINNFSPITIAAAEKNNKPWAMIHLNPPIFATEEFPLNGYRPGFSKWLNIMTYKLFYFGLWLKEKENDKFRRSIGLKGTSRMWFRSPVSQEKLVLHAFSQHLIPKPLDWVENFKITGFLNIKTDQSPPHNCKKLPDNLDEWISEGPKPIYIGFGSMPIPDKERLTEIIEKLLKNTELKIVLCLGWTENLAIKPTSNLFIIDEVDHELLFNKCEMAVIHGGIGTLMTALRASIPVVIVSFFADQPVWGELIKQKKLGLHIPWKMLNVLNLMNSIKIIRTGKFDVEIRSISDQLQKEDGVSNSVYELERYFG